MSQPHVVFLGLTISPGLMAAIEAAVPRHGPDRSSVVRRAVSKFLGDQSLEIVEKRRIGRPPKSLRHKEKRTKL